MVAMRGWPELVRERKTASAMGERQMLPRQTNRTDIGGVVLVSFEVSVAAIGAKGSESLVDDSCPALLRVEGMRAERWSILTLLDHLSPIREGEGS